MLKSDFDAVVIGGGFYGCITALHLHQNGYSVAIVERDSDLLLRASYANQARIHNGYHYPRSFMTAWRSLTNFPRFVADFSTCIDNSFEKIYAIARRNSRVNAYQFRQFCGNIGAPIRPAPQRIKRLFNPTLIEDVFVVQEYAFDANRLREMMRRRLERAGIALRFETEAQAVVSEGDRLAVRLKDGSLTSRYVFNCTYAQLNVLLGASDAEQMPLKHQLAEIALVNAPDELRGLGITVMDGPFFSVMPFPASDTHSLSHVRYTHHETWYDGLAGNRNPYDVLSGSDVRSNFPYMLRDAQRYLPVLADALHVESLFEVKTLLQRNEIDDGRPILFRESERLPGLYSILGGKIDNIFDLLHEMQRFARNLEPS